MRLVELLVRDKESELTERMPRIVNAVARQLSAAWDSAADQITDLETQIENEYMKLSRQQKVQLNVSAIVEKRRVIAELRYAQEIIAAEWQEKLGTAFKPTTFDLSETTD